MVRGSVVALNEFHLKAAFLYDECSFVGVLLYSIFFVNVNIHDENVVEKYEVYGILIGGISSQYYKRTPK